VRALVQLAPTLALLDRTLALLEATEALDRPRATLAALRDQLVARLVPPATRDLLDLTEDKVLSASPTCLAIRDTVVAGTVPTSPTQLAKPLLEPQLASFPLLPVTFSLV